MKIQRFNSLINIDRLAKIIFINFMDLQNEPSIDFSFESIKSILSSASLIGWFIMDLNSKIIGYLIGTISELNDGRNVYFIHYFYIIQKYRRFGIGTKLLLNVINHIDSINIKFIVLICKVNSPGWFLYKKLGWVEDPIIELDNFDYKTLTYYSNN